MQVRYGDGKTEHGPGVAIEMTGDEVATAVAAWLVANGVTVKGPRTVTVNGALCVVGRVYVDPSGWVSTGDQHLNGRGPG